MTTDIQRNTQIYVIGLSGAAVAICVGLVAAGYDLGTDPWTVVALVLVNAIAERSGVYITRTAQMSIALLPTLFAAVLFGPLAAGLVCASSMLGDPEILSRSDPARAPRLKLASYASSRFIDGVRRGLVAQSAPRTHINGVRRSLDRGLRGRVCRGGNRHPLCSHRRTSPPNSKGFEKPIQVD